VRVTPENEMSCRVWRIGPHAILRDRPLASTEIPAELTDFSTGGMGVTLRAPKHEPLRVDPADRLRVEVTMGEKQILIEAHMRHPTAVPKGADMIRAGLQFSDLQNNLEGRQNLAALTKIVGELQRAEIRRARLGMTQTA
jgi:c-di-GMP-binding flagellar brake protein YcgR